MSAYWRDRLLGVEPLELPVDRPRHATALVSRRVRRCPDRCRALAVVERICAFQRHVALHCAPGGLPGTFVSNHRAARFCRRLASKLAHCYVERHDRLLRRPAADARPCRWRTPFSVWLGRVRAAAFGALRHEHPFVLIAEDFVHVRDVVPLSFRRRSRFSKRDLTRTTTAACSSSPKVIACATSATSRPSS